MENVHCNLCDSRETLPVRVAHVRLYGRDNAFHVVRCARCGLVYVNPRPDKEELRAYYPREYQSDMQRAVSDGWDNPVIRVGLEMVLRRRMPSASPGGRLLDIGCTTGRYLMNLREKGWDVQGVEIDADAADIARSQYGLTVHTGDAEDVLPKFDGESLDVITMWHVIEHFSNPLTVLQEVRRILKPGGLLMLELPNFACPFASLFGQYWFPLEVPRHLYQFTPKTLAAMLEKAGFRLTRVKGVPAPEALVWSLNALRNRQPDPLSTHITANPVLMSLAFPISWLLAQFRMSDHMAAVAVRLHP